MTNNIINYDTGETELHEKKVFHAHIDSSLFKKIIKIARAVRDTARLFVTPDGIEINAVDKAMNAMVNINVKKSSFKKYKSSTFQIGLDLDRIKKILDITKTSDSIEIIFHQKENRLIIKTDEMKAQLGIVDIGDIPVVNIEILSSSGHVVVPVAQIKRGISLIEVISEYVKLGIDREKFQMSAEEDVNAVEFLLEKQVLVELESEQYHENFFYIDILGKIIQGLDSDSLMRISFGNDNPLRIDYDLNDDRSCLKFFLTQMIQPD
jgi:proliferating cell nuclear antigen